MKRATFAFVVCLGALIVADARAETASGCKGFAWPLDVELRWLSAASGEATASVAGLAAPPEKAITVSLKPSGSVELPVKPTGKPKSAPEETFAGTIAFDGVSRPGLYQVSLSSAGWIDVVQNGAVLKSVAHTGAKDCPTLHKSVRFEIGSGPLVLQLSSMPASAVKVVLRPAN